MKIHNVKTAFAEGRFYSNGKTIESGILIRLSRPFSEKTSKKFFDLIVKVKGIDIP